MFKKIRSNRDPRDTVYSEIKKEFAPYLDKAKSRAGDFSERNAKTIFWLMAASLLLSGVLTLTVFKSRVRQVKMPRPVIAAAPVSTGFQQIMDAGEAIRQMLALRKMIDSLAAKKQLTGADSARLDKALDRFQELNHKFNQRE